jgi:toxin-antitoxin system PIN domain toxin
MTQQGFLRLVTNPKAIGEQAVSLPDAWRLYDALIRDPRVAFAREPAGIEPLWRSYTASESFSPKIWNDAYLAAFARAAGFQLVTFDRGFARFANLNCRILP